MTNILGRMRIAGDLDRGNSTHKVRMGRGQGTQERVTPFIAQGEQGARQAAAGRRDCKAEWAGYGGQAGPEGRAETAEAESGSLATAKDTEKCSSLRCGARTQAPTGWAYRHPHGISRPVCLSVFLTAYPLRGPDSSRVQRTGAATAGCPRMGRAIPAPIWKLPSKCVHRPSHLRRFHPSPVSGKKGNNHPLERRNLAEGERHSHVTCVIFRVAAGGRCLPTLPLNMQEARVPRDKGTFVNGPAIWEPAGNRRFTCGWNMVDLNLGVARGPQTPSFLFNALV